MAIGRSNALPDLAMSAGARFTVMRLGGTRKPLFCTPAITRSRPSFTAPWGRPTVVERGQAAGHVGLDGHEVRIDAEHGAGKDSCEQWSAPCLSGFVHGGNRRALR